MIKFIVKVDWSKSNVNTTKLPILLSIEFTEKQINITIAKFRYCKALNLFIQLMKTIV